MKLEGGVKYSSDMNSPLIQSVLFTSPYSGCRKFSGWKPDPCTPVSYQSNFGSRQSPGPIMCADKARGSKPQYCQLQSGPSLRTRIWTRFIPAYGNPPDRPYDQRRIQTVSIVPYKLRPIAGPSATGPFTYRSQGQLRSVGGIGATGHNQGLT